MISARSTPRPASAASSLASRSASVPSALMFAYRSNAVRTGNSVLVTLYGEQYASKTLAPASTARWTTVEANVDFPIPGSPVMRISDAVLGLVGALPVPMRGVRRIPQVEHLLEFDVAADERQRCRARRPRRPGQIAPSDHPVDLDRRIDALQLPRPEWLGIELPGHQFVGRGAYEDGVGGRQGLQARRSVQGRAEHANAVDHHDAGIDSDPGVQLDAQLGLQSGSDRAQSGQHVQPRGHRSARVVLMSEGVAETGDDRVALHVDELALVSLDNRPACQLERTQHAAVDLDVVALGERRGLDEIDEQRRRLAAAGKRTAAAMAICQGAEHGGLGVVGLERENVGGQRVHLTPVELLEGSLGHREQLFGSEVSHRPLSPTPPPRSYR